MSQDVLMALAREATSDYHALQRIEALPDEDLARQGLDADEITAVRNGFFERLMALGVPLDGTERQRSGCC